MTGYRYECMGCWRRRRTLAPPWTRHLWMTVCWRRRRRRRRQYLHNVNAWILHTMASEGSKLQIHQAVTIFSGQTD